MGKQPIRKGVARVPVVMQLEALECGAACLCMLMSYYDKWLPLEQVRKDCGVSRDGSNALNVAKAARSYGMEAKGRRCGGDTQSKALHHIRQPDKAIGGTHHLHNGNLVLTVLHGHLNGAKNDKQADAQ